MDSSSVLHIAGQAMIVVAKLAAPMVLTAFAVGFAISLVQSVTQIQEVSLSFVPKAIAVAIVLILCGNWMIGEMVSFTTGLFHQIPRLLGG